MTKLVLRGHATPRVPSVYRARQPLGKRSSRAVAARVTHEVADEILLVASEQGLTISEWLGALIRQGLLSPELLPIDVMDWLEVQSAATGRPGDLNHALVHTLRNLAETYPDGCRLDA